QPSPVSLPARACVLAKADPQVAPDVCGLPGVRTQPPESADRAGTPSSIPEHEHCRTQGYTVATFRQMRAGNGEMRIPGQKSGRAARSDGAPRENTDKASRRTLRGAEWAHLGTARGVSEPR